MPAAFLRSEIPAKLSFGTCSWLLPPGSGSSAHGVCGSWTQDEWSMSTLLWTQVCLSLAWVRMKWWLCKGRFVPVQSGLATTPARQGWRSLAAADFYDLEQRAISRCACHTDTTVFKWPDRYMLRKASHGFLQELQATHRCDCYHFFLGDWMSIYVCSQGPLATLQQVFAMVQSPPHMQ